MNRNVTNLGTKLYSPSLKKIARLEDARFIFLIFHTFVCKFGRVDAVRGKKITDNCMARAFTVSFYFKLYGKLQKLTERLLAKLHPSNLVNTTLYLDL